MIESEWITYWQQVLANVYIPDWVESRILPSKAHLDALETKLGLPLPLSYRAFIQVFGPGQVARSFVIFAPGYPTAPRVDFPDATGWQYLVEESPEREALTDKLVAFGDFHGHNGVFVWHRGMPTDSTNRDYQIYFLPRPSREPLIPIASSFSAFVADDLLKSGFFPKYGVDLSKVEMEWEDEDTGEIRTRYSFDPIGSSVTPVEEDPRLK